MAVLWRPHCVIAHSEGFLSLHLIPETVELYESVSNIYHLSCRLEWEGSVKRGVTVLRRLEEERLGQLSAVSRLFLGIMMTNRPKMISLTERLREPVDLCNVARDSEVRMSLVTWVSKD